MYLSLKFSSLIPGEHFKLYYYWNRKNIIDTKMVLEWLINYIVKNKFY